MSDLRLDRARPPVNNDRRSVLDDPRVSGDFTRVCREMGLMDPKPV